MILYEKAGKNDTGTWSVTVRVTLIIYIFWLLRTELFCLYLDLHLSFFYFLFYIGV